jgi:hypothetical protein
MDWLGNTAGKGLWSLFYIYIANRPTTLLQGFVSDYYTDSITHSVGCLYYTLSFAPLTTSLPVLYFSSVLWNVLLSSYVQGCVENPA